MAAPSIQYDSCDLDLFRELEEVLDSNGLDRENICIVGSTCLAVRGLRPHGDIDVCINPSISKSTPFGGSRYEVLGISDEELFNDRQFSEMVDGWRIVRPEIEYCYKKQRRRDKDKIDVKLLTEYKQTSNEWNHRLESEYCLPRSIILWKNFWRSLQQDGFFTTLRRTVRYAIGR